MDKNIINEKHKEVHAWLAGMFEDKDVPNFEVNKITVSRLHKLMNQNREMDRIGALAVDDLNQKTEEYKMEANRIHEILEAVGMPAYVLSNAGKASLKNLTDLANALRIKDVNKSSFYLALAELVDQLSSIKEEIEQKKKDIEKLKKQYDDCTAQLGNINSFYEKIEESSFVDVPVLQKRKKDTETLIQKSATYHNQIHEFEADEEHIEKQKHLHHDTLLKIAQQLDELKKELQPLQQKHTSYKSLPPDINMAKVKIEEARRQLMKLEKQLQTDIDLLAL